MNFIYRDADTGELNIRRAEHVKVSSIFGLREDGSHGTTGYVIAPMDYEPVGEIIDAAIHHALALNSDEPEYIDAMIDHGPTAKLKNPRINSVYSQMQFDDPEFGALGWYETQEEAERELFKIAEAIARGDQIYYMTDKEDTP